MDSDEGVAGTWASVAGDEVDADHKEMDDYIFAEAEDRLNKERAMRRRQLKALWKRLGQLKQMKLNARNLLLKLGEAKGRYPAAWRLIDIQLPEPTAEGNSTFAFALNRQKLQRARRREGRYLLRTNLCGRNPAQLWEFYIQLVEIEAAFKNLKDDLALRPIFHQLEHRIEAHIFVAFIATCLHVTLRARLRPLAPGLTPRAVLDKFATIQMLDVHFPTTDGRTLILSRYTHPEPDHRLLLGQLNLTLPAQPPPHISSRGAKVEPMTGFLWADLFDHDVVPERLPGSRTPPIEKDGLKQMKLNARNLLLKLGEAKGRYPAAWRLIDIQLPEPTAEGNSTFAFALNRQKLQRARRREGRYLLRTNLCGRNPAQLWEFYIQLVEIEAAFKNLKDDLALRPIFHQLEHRIEAHIFVAFIAYCLHVTLRARLVRLPPA